MTDHKFKPESTNNGRSFSDCSCGWQGGVYPSRAAARDAWHGHATGGFISRPYSHNVRVRSAVLVAWRPDMTTMWIAEDDGGEPSAFCNVHWGDPRFPTKLICKSEIPGPGRNLLWDLIVRTVERETPHIQIWHPGWRSCHLGYDSTFSEGWWWRCRFPATDTVCHTSATADHTTALADALAHLASEHAGGGE